MRSGIGGGSWRRGRGGEGCRVWGMCCGSWRCLRKCCGKKFLGLSNLIGEVLNVGIMFVSWKVKDKCLYRE